MTYEEFVERTKYIKKSVKLEVSQITDNEELDKKLKREGKITAEEWRLRFTANRKAKEAVQRVYARVEMMIYNER